jgi:hypothetical protein
MNGTAGIGIFFVNLPAVRRGRTLFTHGFLRLQSCGRPQIMASLHLRLVQPVKEKGMKTRAWHPLSRSLGSQHGSALLGAIALSIVFGMMAMGYLQVTTNAANDEQQALIDLRAFYAAESGLQMGTRWVREGGNFDQTQMMGEGASLTDVIPNLTINQFPVQVNIVRQGSGVLVQATAQSRPRLGYDKLVSWLARQKTGGYYGTFINDIATTNTEGFISTIFEGPFHSNSPIFLAQGALFGVGISSMFKGPVTVANDPDPTRHFTDGVMSSGDYGGYGTSSATGNNYDFGIYYKTGTAPVMDKAFSSTYAHSQPPQTMNFNTAGCNVVVLPPTLLSGEALEQPNTRPTLEFYVESGVGRYRFYGSGGGAVQAAGTIPDNCILYAPNAHLNVQGTVKGKVTVVSDMGKSIFPTGDLVYDGFTYSDAAPNHGLAADNPNLIALKSGKDIGFGPNSYNPASGAVGKEDIKMQFLTAQLVMMEGSGSHVWMTKNHSAEFDPTKYANGYAFKAIGSRSMGSYMYFKDQGVASGRTVDFFYDTRLSNNVNAPGFRGFSTTLPSGQTLWSLFYSGWQSRNITG